MVIKYKGHSLGFNAEHIPPGLPEKLEKILFPDTGDDILDGDEYEEIEIMKALDETVASALSEICPRVAPVLRQGLIERVASLATEKEMQTLNYWQGRVTPQNSGIFEGIFQFSLLQGSDENVVNWWHFTFSKRRMQWRRKATNIYYLLNPWRGNKDEASSSGIIIRNLFAKTLVSFLDERPSISQIAQYESGHLDEKENVASLSVIAETYAAITNFAMQLAENRRTNLRSDANYFLKRSQIISVLRTRKLHNTYYFVCLQMAETLIENDLRNKMSAIAHLSEISCQEY